VFQNIAAGEAAARPAPGSFADAVHQLDALLRRQALMFPSSRPQPDDDELRAHEALYERARRRAGSG
jgi:hypothetical protein